jgi:hypothetical protein
MNVQPAPVEDHESTDHAVNEERRVHLWRYDGFVSLGFAAEQARALARNGAADLALGRRLAALGCPPQLAFRILA